MNRLVCWVLIIRSLLTDVSNNPATFTVTVGPPPWCWGPQDLRVKTPYSHIRKGNKRIIYHEDGSSSILRNIRKVYYTEYCRSHTTEVFILRNQNIPWNCILLPMWTRARCNLSIWFQQVLVIDFDRSHRVVLFNIHKVFYSVTHNINIYSQ